MSERGILVIQWKKYCNSNPFIIKKRSGDLWGAKQFYPTIGHLCKFVWWNLMYIFRLYIRNVYFCFCVVFFFFFYKTHVMWYQKLLPIRFKEYIYFVKISIIWTRMRILVSEESRKKYMSLLETAYINRDVKREQDHWI